ncbi:MAG: putative H4MPT-linked transfer pathway protein [Planctomycetota bacterium]|nr:putative H4MPT-linked transfer pathway protein [Planctomycetota bacterium]
MTTPPWLGLDIGGANLKAAHTSGVARSVAFALWKLPERLPETLAHLAAAMPRADHVAVTMTGELCDCFRTKAEGVRTILQAVLDVFLERTVRVWTTDGTFEDPFSVILRPETAAAANWLALATLGARLAPKGPAILVDIGSTTADLIPLRDGVPVPRGRTDTDRLRTGELVYAGVSRTPVCALATTLPHRGEPTGLAAELFATTRDVYLTLGDLDPAPDDNETADGRPVTREAARDRLSRMVGADRDGFSEADALAFAREADATLMARLIEAAERACLAATGARPHAAIVSGSGEFLSRRLAERILAPGGRIVSLREQWGQNASSAACAHALAVLAAEEPR